MKSFQLVTPATFCLSILSVSASVQATDIVSPANVTGSNTALILNSTTQNWSIKSNGALSIERGGIIPILLDRNAGASAIFVDSDGDTALGTITPSNDFNSRLHIEDPTPDIAFKTPWRQSGRPGACMQMMLSLAFVTRRRIRKMGGMCCVRFSLWRRGLRLIRWPFAIVDLWE